MMMIFKVSDVNDVGINLDSCKYWIGNKVLVIYYVFKILNDCYFW